MKLIDGIVYLEMADAEKCGIGDSEYLWNERFKGAKWAVFIPHPDNKDELLIEYHSLSKKQHTKVTDCFGDPLDYLIQQPIRSMIAKDIVAEKFYREFRYDNGEHLSAETINVYTVAASWLNMLIQAETNKKQLGLQLNISITEFYVHVTELVERDQIHLPSNIIGLRQTMESYKSEGYITLVPKQPATQSGIQINEPASDLVVEPAKGKDRIRIALIDDHILVRNALTVVIDSFEECVVVNQSNNGKEMVNAFLAGTVPDIAILDLHMPVMDGFETADWLQKNFPKVHILMLTMYDSDVSLIRLLQKGIKGFLKKNSHTSELKFAILSIMQSGFYYSHHITGKLVNMFYGPNKELPLQKSLLSDQEIEFLKLTCSELTYKEIAKTMKLNARTIDVLRNHLFTKLDVRSRVGLAMVAIKNGLAPIS